MRRTIAAASVAASIAVGGLAGVALGSPAIAGAVDAAAGPVGWVRDALGGLVDDGTITQDQADAVEAALEEARPEGGFERRGGFGSRIGLDAVAEALGLGEEELRAAVEGGETLAEVAARQGVDVQVVVDAIVAAEQEDLAEAVTEGRLTQEQADELLAGAGERATAMVNGELPPLRHGPGGRGPWGPHADDAADTDEGGS